MRTRAPLWFVLALYSLTSFAGLCGGILVLNWIDPRHPFVAAVRKLCLELAQ